MGSKTVYTAKEVEIFRDSLKGAIKQAQNTKGEVSFSNQGIELTIKPDSTVDGLTSDYYDKLRARELETSQHPTPKWKDRVEYIDISAKPVRR